MCCLTFQKKGVIVRAGCIFFCSLVRIENHSQISPTDRHTIIAHIVHPLFSDGRKITEFASTIIKNFNSRAVTTPACLWLFLQFCISVLFSLCSNSSFDHRYQRVRDDSGVSFDGRNFACWSHEHLESIYPTRRHIPPTHSTNLLHDTGVPYLLYLLLLPRHTHTYDGPELR